MHDEPTEKLTNRYNREARAYRDLWAPILHVPAGRLIRALQEGSVSLVVDVGSGVGTLLPALREAFPAARVVGVDRSHGMLTLAPSSFPRAVMDATQLAIADDSVDRVVIAFVLFHLEQPADGLKEARRILRPTGRVGTLTWGADLESQALRSWSKCLSDHGAPEPDPAVQTRHEPVNTPLKMEQILVASGFDRSKSWEEELVTRIDLELLLRLKTSMGSEKPRFDALDLPVRKACMVEGRRRLRRLAPEDFLARGSVIFGVGLA